MYLVIQIGRTLWLLTTGLDDVMHHHFQRTLVWMVATGPLWIVGAVVDSGARLILWGIATAIDLVGMLRLDWTDGVPVVPGSSGNSPSRRCLPRKGTRNIVSRATGAANKEPVPAALGQFCMWTARSDLISEKTAAGFYETRTAYGFSGDRLSSPDGGAGQPGLESSAAASIWIRV